MNIINFNLILTLILLGGVLYFIMRCKSGVKSTIPARLKSRKFQTPVEKLEESFSKNIESIVDSITPDTIDSVKQKLLENLEYYKEFKLKAIADNLKSLTKFKSELEIQLNTTNNEIELTMNSLKSLKAKEVQVESDIVAGGQLMYSIKILNDSRDSLDSTLNDLNKKIDEVKVKLKTFNVRYSIEKSKILTMIAQSAVISDYSEIDRNLHQLIMDFQDKVTELKIDSEVYSTVDKHDSPTYDPNIYEDMYKRFEVEQS